MTSVAKDALLIEVAEFSPYPIGRDDRDSDFNGERFRRELLAPAIKQALSKGVKLTVSFRGVLSFGSSFLEEAFGGLISKEGLKPQDVLRTLQFDLSEDDADRYDGVINDMIREARPAN